MSNSFDLSASEQRENIKEFMEVHGLEGFFTLYFRQLFYRYIKQELKSTTEEIDGVGEQLYFAEDGDELLIEYREELLEQCEARARELVNDLVDDSHLGSIIKAGDLNSMDEYQDEFTEAVHERFKEWEDEGIDLLEEVESENSKDEK